MNFTHCTVLACAIALLVCKTTPSSSATKTQSVPGEEVASNRAGKPVPLDQQAFTVVATTNQLDPQWLRAPTNFFRLGPGDEIEIEILREAASHSSVIVGPD